MPNNYYSTLVDSGWVTEATEKPTNLTWEVTQTSSETAASQSSELEEIYSIIFPDEPNYHNFPQVKKRISELKINELTLQVKNQQEAVNNLVNEAKNKLDLHLHHVVDLLLENQKAIEQKKEESPEYLQGRKEAYQTVLVKYLQATIIKNIIDQGTELYHLEEQLANLKRNYYY